MSTSVRTPVLVSAWPRPQEAEVGKLVKLEEGMGQVLERQGTAQRPLVQPFFVGDCWLGW